MPAHVNAASFSDTIYAISASLPATYDPTGYAALTYTTIDRVSTFPEFGAQSNVNEFVPISGPVEYIKGARRFGTGDVIVADVPADPGQVLMKAAEASQNHYSIKITYPDSEVHYLDVIVSSWKLSGASEGTVMTRTATVSLGRDPVIVAAT